MKATPRWGLALLKRLDPWMGLIAAGIYFVLVLTLHSFGGVFEFDPDEGNNLIKSLMLSRGHALYSEVWSDQPPLFCYLLMWWLEAFGWSTYAARVLVLLFGSAIVFAVYDSLRIVSGHPAATAGALLLPCSMEFVRLSVSAMLGLPSLAFAMLCVWALLRWTQHRRAAWLLAAGVLIGSSLMTKLFAGFLLPVLGIGLLIAAARRQEQWSFDRATLLPAAIWTLATTATVALIILWTVPLSGLDQLYDAHLAARDSAFFTSPEKILRAVEALHQRIRDDWQLVTLAGLGLVGGLLTRRWALLIPGVWCVLSYVLLRHHRPVWYHHQLLLTLPICILAGAAAGALVSGGWKPQRARLADLPRALVRVAALVLVVWLAADLARGQKNFQQPRPMSSWANRDRFAAEVMRAYADVTDIALVDRQMYAVHAGVDIPPNLSVTSHKRFNTGNLATAEILRFVAEQRPQQVSISQRFWSSRKRLYRSLVKAVRDDYVLVYADPGIKLKHFVRRDVVGDPIATLKRVIRREPAFAGGYDVMGLMHNRRGQTEQALSAFSGAVRVDPTYGRAHKHLGDTIISSGKVVEGFEHLRRSMTLEGGSLLPPVARHYAWRRATFPDEAHRNGEQALRIIRAILKAGDAQPRDSIILAAALAADGQFDGAVQSGTKNLQVARSSPRLAHVARQLQQQIASHQKGVLLTRRVRAPQWSGDLGRPHGGPHAPGGSTLGSSAPGSCHTADKTALSSAVSGPARLNCQANRCVEAFCDFLGSREVVVARAPEELRALLEDRGRSDLFVVLEPKHPGEVWLFDTSLKPVGDNKTVYSPGEDGPILSSSGDLMLVGDRSGARRVRNFAVIGATFERTGDSRGNGAGDIISIRRGAQGVYVALCSFLGVGDEVLSVTHNFGDGGHEPVTVSVRNNTFDGGLRHQHSYAHLFGSKKTDGGFRVETIGNVYRGYKRRGCRAQGSSTYVNCSGNVYLDFSHGVVEFKSGARGIVGYNVFAESPDPFDSNDFGLVAIWHSFLKRGDGGYTKVPDRGDVARFEAQLPMPISSGPGDPFFAGLIEAAGSGGPTAMRRYIEARAGPTAPQMAALKARVASLRARAGAGSTGSR